LGFSQFLLAKLLVTIPSYVYFLDRYNQGVGKEALQKYAWRKRRLPSPTRIDLEELYATQPNQD
jgi:hypothetical protein